MKSHAKPLPWIVLLMFSVGLIHMVWVTFEIFVSPDTLKQYEDAMLSRDVCVHSEQYGIMEMCKSRTVWVTYPYFINVIRLVLQEHEHHLQQIWQLQPGNWCPSGSICHYNGSRFFETLNSTMGFGLPLFVILVLIGIGLVMKIKYSLYKKHTEHYYDFNERFPQLPPLCGLPPSRLIAIDKHNTFQKQLSLTQRE